ncbi:hypothetical protein GMMP15_660038 [Candidatus Magnetomoraceae bacterium gMMP-15]
MTIIKFSYLKICVAFLLIVVLILPLSSYEENYSGQRASSGLSLQAKFWNTEALEGKKYIYKLLHPDLSDDEEARLFSNAVKLFKAEKWGDVINVLKKLIEDHSKSRLMERAFFLLAICVDHLFEKELDQNFTQVVQTYKKAINKFSKSDYVPYAYISIGNVYFKLKKYYQVLFYYDFAYQRHYKPGPVILLRNGIVLKFTKKPDDALKIFDKIISHFPDNVYAVKAKVEKAKILYDKKAFTNSQRLLDEVMATASSSIYKNPDILLYSGYNYYETGQFKKALKALLRILNYYPDIESNHLILTRIADIYMEDGFELKALKLYNMVMNTYPETDGGVISALRLADKVKISPEERYAKQTIKEISYNRLPFEIYENIINKHPDSPLAHLAMLKMAIKKHEKENYEGSIITLKNMLAKYPETRLKRDIRAALQSSINAVIKQEYEKQLYDKVIKFYDQSKDILSMNDLSGDFIVMVGYSYLSLQLYDRALNMFKKAMNTYMVKDQPADLLFGMGEAFYNLEMREKAKEIFENFILKYQKDDRIAKTYCRIAKILFDNKKYEKASYYYELALIKNLKIDRPSVLMAMADSLILHGRYHSAAEALKERLSLLEKNKDAFKEKIYDTYYKLGDIYFKMGDKKQAVSYFDEALKVSSKGEKDLRIQFRVAECYRHLEVREKAEKVLTQIINANDKFWSNLASIKLKEIQMSKSLEEFNKDK